MSAVVTSLMLAFGQLADPRVLAVLAKSLAVTLALFALAVEDGWYALDWSFALFGLEDASFRGAEQVRGIAAFLLTVVGLWLTWRLVAMAVIEFFADDVVLAVEARHYPQAALAARDLPLHEQFSTSLKAALRALLFNLIALPFGVLLLITGLGTAILFWAVNAVLLGRELPDTIWLRHRRDASDAAPVTGSERFLLGAAISALLAVPVVNLVAPLLGAAAATHLIHRPRQDGERA
jgi:uncharacterized protein involved in cysteine biosynthesis